MTEQENLQIQLRESKMRLRELRTENAELKIQYRRWLLLSVGVSFLSFSLSVVLAMMLNFSSDEVDLPATNAQNELASQENIVPPTQDAAKIPKLGSKNNATDSLTPPPIDVPEPHRLIPLANKETEANKATIKLPSGKKDTRTPTLALDEPKSSEDESSATPAPSVAQPFSLPSSSNKAQKEVKRYVVQKNDSLWKIVGKYYGAATPTRIKKVMKDHGLTDINLRPGTTLLLIIDE